MLLTCVILGWIVFRDLRDHIITNTSLAFLSGSLLITFQGHVNLISALLSFVLLLIFSMLFDLGGGDAKLITILVLLAEVDLSFLQVISLSTVLVCIQISLIWIANRKIPSRIALAPAICIPLIYSMTLH